MSLLSWFMRKSAPAKPRAADASGLLNADATVPLMPGRDGRPLLTPSAPPEHAANRVNERMERRELLYIVVRDAMVRAGVLSASYKFKVLSLDQRGRQFLIMMDLAREYGGETVRLSEIEALIAQTAKTRYDIAVTAVYWRINDHVAVGLPQKGIAPHGASVSAAPAAPSAPMPPVAPVPRPTPRPAAPERPLLQPRPEPVVAAPVRPAQPPGPLLTPTPPAPNLFDPIEADEVAAFNPALATAAAARPTSPAPLGVSVQTGPLLHPSPSDTGFADTEMPTHDPRAPDLSSTQYGELR